MTETVDLYIVIDTATRVIKTVTIDPNVNVRVTDTLVKIPDQVKIYTISDSNTGINIYCKNVDGNKVPATTEELEAMSWATTELPDGTKQYWMLDLNNKKVPANSVDIDALGIDPAKERIKREQRSKTYRDTTEKLSLNEKIDPELKEFFIALLGTL